MLLVIVAGIFMAWHKRYELVAALQQTILDLTSPNPEERMNRVAEQVTPDLKEKLDSKGLRFGAPVFVRIFKESNEVELWMEDPESRFILYKTYELCARSGDLGPKVKSRDKQCPEGFYFVKPSGMNPTSRYHMEMDLGYPNDYDRHHKYGGQDVHLQGGCTSNGSFSLSNGDIEEVFTLSNAAISAGQSFVRIHVFPFRMTDARMDQVLKDKSEWLDFWSNLKEGYDYFEIVGHPPTTKVVEGQYAFE